ncbi:MAG: Gfo/Idh/MocA family oxidoreductase [Chloroflexota bacterium]|nr:MAG: Gfo/Idh/MocA family oxidoreductase [Chloroflexota bacterium]
MTVLGVGIIGLHEGRTLLRTLNLPIPAVVGAATETLYRAPHARAVAACDINPDKLNEARRDLPDLFYTTDYDALLRRDDVHIVAIYTPDQYHAEHIIRAFEAGKHVICTKPLINRLDEAPRLREAARRTGGKLLVGQSTRFFEPFRRQRAAYEAGDLGALELLDAHYIHRMDWFYEKSAWAASATDWAFLGLSHPLDLASWYLGPIAEVSAFGAQSALARRYGLRSYDIYTVNLRAADGRVGRALGHYGLHELPSARNCIELMLYGADGSSLAQYHDMRYLHTRPDGAEVEEDFLYTQRAYYFNNEVHGMHYGEFASYTEYFARALLENCAYSPNLDEGLATVCVMEAARQSAHSGGQPVAVAPLLAQTM